jgi:hypothetical protein
MFDAILAMNDEVEFVALIHNLLLIKVTKGEDFQFYMNMISGIQVSPQAKRKTWGCLDFTSLDLECSKVSNATTLSDTSILQEQEIDHIEDSNQELTSRFNRQHYYPKTTYS